ncbi:MAG: bacteriocin immunity protein [Lachnospiraceae bacterium]|nr:bacteriocin immunity protein [Lachnospiraceae bacterium]MCM1238647.1 bacteriocin immunity protein [Lachnospiraceae bacterium]
MSEKLSREELVDLVGSIMTMRDKKTGKKLSGKAHHEMVMKFKQSIDHPGGTDLIYYPESVGLSANPTVDEIVDLAIKEIPSKE